MPGIIRYRTSHGLKQRLSGNVLLALVLIALCAPAWAAPQAPQVRARLTVVTTKPVELADASAAKPRRVALVIGIDRYEDSLISSLQFAAADATAFAETLTRAGDLRPDDVFVMTDAASGEHRATRANILAAVERFLKLRVTSSDEVIVFLSGHGIAKGVGENARSYFLPTDVKGTSPEALQTSAVDLRDLMARLSELGAGQYTLIVDACRNDPVSGRGDRANPMTDVMARDLRLVGRAPDGVQTRSVTSVVLSSCKVGERSYEDAVAGHGVFTQGLLQGIQGGVAQPPDGAVDAGRLYGWVREHIDRWVRSQAHDIQQTPTLSASEMSRAVVLLNVSKSTAGTWAFDPKEVDATISTVPSGAMLEPLDSNGTAAVTPVTLPLAPGTHRFRATKGGYVTQEIRVGVLPGYASSVEVLLAPKSRAVKRALTLFRAGQLAEGAQMWTVAAARYKAATKADAKFADAWQRYAEVMLVRGNAAEALLAVGKAVTLEPKVATFRVTMASAQLALAEQGQRSARLAKARQSAEVALKLDANSVEAQRVVGRVQLANNRTEAALETLSSLTATAPGDAAAHRDLASVLTRMDKSEEASRELRTALRLRPGYYEAQRDLAFLLHRRGESDAAMQAYERVAALRGSTESKDEVAAVNVAMAGLRQEAGDAAEMAAYRDDALEIQPDVKKIAVILVREKVAPRIPALPGVELGEPHSTIQPGPQDSQQMVEAEANGIEFSLVKCWRIGRIVKCAVSVVSRLDSTVPFHLDAAGCHAIDEDGDQHSMSELTWEGRGTRNSRGAGAEVSLFTDKPELVTCIFSDIPDAVTHISIVIRGSGHTTVVLKGITVRRARR